MALNLIYGPSGSGKTHSLFTYILKEAIKNPELNYYIIVPEQYTLSTQKKLIELSEVHGILNVDVLSFDRLSYRIFEEVGFGETSSILMDDMGKNLVLRHLANENEDALSFLSGNMRKLGYITEIKSVISEFKQYRISDKEIEDMIASANNSGKTLLARKLKDIKVVYDSFDTYIKDKYTTSEEILELAARKVFESEKLKKSIVIFDGFTGFTPVQYGLIDSLLQISRDMYMTFLMDCRDNVAYNTEHELFYMTYNAEKHLKKLCEKNNVVLNIEYKKNEIPVRFDTNKKRLIHLEKNLFREYKASYNEQHNGTKEPTKVVNGEIRVFTALTPDEEVKSVAVFIRKLIKEHAYRYKDIAIVTGDLEVYSPIITREFKKYGIPVFTDKKSPILLNPFVEYVRSIIEIITSNWSYEAVFRLLRSELSGYKTDDIDILENFVLKKGIKGYNSWHTDWEIKYKRNYKKGDIKENQLLNNIENIRKEIVEGMSAIDVLSEYEDKNTQTSSVNKLNTEFYGILERLDVQNRLYNLSEKYKETDDIFANERTGEFEKVYEETIKLFEKMNELLGEEKISIEEYGQLLDAGFDEIRIGIIPNVSDYIQVGDVTRSRFSDIHVLFIVGANDGVIPKNNSNGGIISDIEKEFLLDSIPEIELSPSVRMKSFTSQLYLYMLMTKPDKSLFISYSKLNLASESIKPSFIVKTIFDMFDDIPLERDMFSVSDYIYNDETAISCLCENLLCDDEMDNLLNYLYKKDDYKELIEKIIESNLNVGIFENEDKLSKAVANVLYTSSLHGTVTKLEKYASCAYQFFLEYGLNLKERELFELNNKDLGTLFHDSLEKYSKKVSDAGKKWTEIDDDTREAYVQSVVEEALTNSEYAVFFSDFRKKYVINRVKRIVNRSVNVLTKQLSVGDFTPMDVEVEFSSVNDLKAYNFELSDTERMHLSGKIDRIDTCEDDENLYVKIIDYKTSNKTFNLLEVYKGLNLQLVVYLNAAKELISKKTGKNVIPAGILYYRADDPLVEIEDEATKEEVEKKISEALKMNGLVNSDEKVYRLIDNDFNSKSDVIPIEVNKDGSLSKRANAVSTDNFEIISEFVNKKMVSMGQEILSGVIKAEPHSKDGVDDKHCSYCNFSKVCKYRPNSLTPSEDDSSGYGGSISNEEVIKIMDEELKQESNK